MPLVNQIPVAVSGAALLVGAKFTPYRDWRRTCGFVVGIVMIVGAGVIYFLEY
jgi:type IV secretory pathway VirB2 component (pilin)